MDKQIIDGVDVSGCPHYKTGDCLVSPVWCDQFYNCDYKELKRKEQECEGLRYEIGSLENDRDILQEQLDQLKAEVKSKTEYIQEQRDIINQYSKEIEMYKKCQGKRASKREEELKAENKELKETFDGLFKIQYKLADNNKKLRQSLTEIKDIVYLLNDRTMVRKDICDRLDVIIQKISECEVE